MDCCFNGIKLHFSLVLREEKKIIKNFEALGCKESGPGLGGTETAMKERS